jgi:hypothetical protein
LAWASGLGCFDRAFCFGFVGGGDLFVLATFFTRKHRGNGERGQHETDDDFFHNELLNTIQVNIQANASENQTLWSEHRSIYFRSML